MLMKRINRSDPERIFIVAYNSYSTASLTTGQSVQWDYVTDQDGVSVTKPASSASDAHNGSVIAGIAAETIAAGAYGLIQVYGYHSAVRARGFTGGGAKSIPTLAAGVPLTCTQALFCLETFRFQQVTCSATYTVNQFHTVAFWLGASSTLNQTTQTGAAFIKAL